MNEVDRIKEVYSRPRKLTYHHDTPGVGYTVGGALCRWAERSNNFHRPSAPQVARALVSLNPLLPRRIASAAAYAIDEANDEKDFAAAWAIAAKAVEFGRSR